MKASVTIADVAKAAGVSMQTVSRVINAKGEISPTTRQRVLEAIEQLGYRPNSIARGLATNKTFTLGLIVPDITNPFFPEIVQGAEQVALEHGYTVVLGNTNESPEREMSVLSILEARRVDGLILCSSRLSEEQLLPLLEKHNEVVLINRQVALDNVSMVRVDYVWGTKMAVSHLIAHSRRRIGFLAGPPISHSQHMRLQAFIQTLQESGEHYDPSYVLSCTPNTAGGYLASRELLLRNPDLDGLLCYNDLVAIGVLQACVELNVAIPDKLAVIGYDDIQAAHLVTPALTTVGISKSMLGTHAAQLLLKRLAGDQRGVDLLLTPKLIVRSSTP
ncbi:MAG TPA: LacI family DNA-binding transcriptional regulator [Ktedonobacteraceae bacterium]